MELIILIVLWSVAIISSIILAVSSTVEDPIKDFLLPKAWVTIPMIILLLILAGGFIGPWGVLAYLGLEFCWFILFSLKVNIQDALHKKTP